jgi:hypothetical protein
MKCKATQLIHRTEINCCIVIRRACIVCGHKYLMHVPLTKYIMLCTNVVISDKLCVGLSVYVENVQVEQLSRARRKHCHIFSCLTRIYSGLKSIYGQNDFAAVRVFV